MNIAVFSDVHGRVLLAFLLAARWQRETGERLDAILQAGDLGVYPTATGLDRATIQHARRDPAELGFSTYFAAYHEDIAGALSRTSFPMIFARGNHEDHAWLDALERQMKGPLFPIDAYRRIHCLQTGAPYTLRASDGSGESLTILGVGRIGAPSGAATPRKPKYIQEYEEERLYDLGSLALDVLLTHDVPRHSHAPHTGMDEIRLILETYKPRYHFYGHTEEPYREQMDSNGVTTAIRLADLNWHDPATRGRLSPDVMGILLWHDRQNASFAPVRAPWLDDYNQWNWRTRINAE
jgi:hypothetical protein